VAEEQSNDEDWPWQWAGTSQAPKPPVPPAEQPSAPDVRRPRASEPVRRPRPVKRPAPVARPRARSVTPRATPARERPSLGQPHGRQRLLDAGLLILAVVVVVLAVLALQG